MSSLSPLAQLTLAEPWPCGQLGRQFWTPVDAVFCGQEYSQQVKALRGERLNAKDLREFDQVISQLDLTGVQLLSLDFISEYYKSPIPAQALTGFIKRAPNLRLLRLSYRFYVRLGHPKDFLPSRKHSTTLRSLELSNMTLQNGSGALADNARALWITMIQFLSRAMSLESVKLNGYFTTDTNKTWTTRGKKNDFICPRRNGCLLSRIENFIIHGGPCLFTYKTSKSHEVDIEASRDERALVPERSWTWEEDDTWRFAAFLINI
ncbi:hypothetical protein B0J14DRAFT_566920 [Halenospora varia]|nr:hypothetical protein B0J14DRAFT_566920 [Halenospora varia]